MCQRIQETTWVSEEEIGAGAEGDILLEDQIELQIKSFKRLDVSRVWVLRRNSGSCTGG